MYIRRGGREARELLGIRTKALYFAPKASYAASADAVAEFAEMVDALHENGIECLMEF